MFPMLPSGALQLGVCCRIKGARRHWITARAGLNGARPRRSPTEVHCARSDRCGGRRDQRGTGTVRGRYGRPNARRGNPQRSPAIAAAAPNRARIYLLESVKRLLRRQIDDTGGNLPRAWRNSISIDAGCRRFPTILPNSAGFVPGLAGNTMLPAYCSRDPSGVKARFKRVLRKEHACRVITTAPGRQLRAAE